MKTIINAELFKVHKKKIPVVLLGLNCLPLLYALGIYYQWSWISFSGEFDLIRYVSAMFQLLFILGVPLILFMYIGSSILGTERIQGQLILEKTRASSLVTLIAAKFISMLILILLYCAINIIISTLCYVFLIAKTEYAMNAVIQFDPININLIISCAAAILYIILSTFFSMFISIKYSAIVSTISGCILFAVLSLGTGASEIGQWIPGYFALNASANSNSMTISYQFLICILLILVLPIVSTKLFQKIDL